MKLSEELIKTRELTKIGREMAVGRIASAGEMADGVDQFRNHIALLQIEASHVLATLAFNELQDGGKSERDSIEKIMRGIRKELFFIRQQMIAGNVEMASSVKKADQ